MALNDFYRTGLPDNYERKLPVVLVLDTSGSMRGKKIKELNTGVNYVIDEIKGDVTTFTKVELSVIRFSTDVEVINGFLSADKIDSSKLKAGGDTNIEKALRTARNIIAKRVDEYRLSGINTYRPLLILITDGGPWPRESQDIDRLAKEMYVDMSQKKYNFLAFGVSKANMKVLRQLSHPDMPPRKIRNENFKGLFKFLSDSIKIISKSRANEQIELPFTNKLFINQ